MLTQPICLCSTHTEWWLAHNNSQTCVLGRCSTSHWHLGVFWHGKCQSYSVGAAASTQCLVPRLHRSSAAVAVIASLYACYIVVCCTWHVCACRVRIAGSLNACCVLTLPLCLTMLVMMLTIESDRACCCTYIGWCWPQAYKLGWAWQVPDSWVAARHSVCFPLDGFSTYACMAGAPLSPQFSAHLWLVLLQCAGVLFSFHHHRPAG